MTEKFKRKIQGLSKIFSNFKIYPLSCYHGSFAEHFIKTHSDNYFAQDLVDFLNLHDYQQDRIGADLPWWGEKYFSDEDGPRVFIIAQDSNSEDAGSVTFYANLMQIMSESQYKSYISNFQRFDGWKMTKELFELCGLNLDFTYITDSRKVYPEDSLSYQNKQDDCREIKEKKRKIRRKFLCSKKNTDINRELLIHELTYCDPDLVVVLGTSGLELLGVTKKLTTILEGDCSVEVNGKEYCVAPFPSRANAIYEKYKLKAVEEIRKKINKLAAR